MVGGLIWYAYRRRTRQSGDANQDREQKSLLAPAVGLLLVSGFLVGQGAVLSYTVRAANHLEQYQRIVAPYLAEQERLQLASKAAQITTRDDYVVVISELAAIADRHGLKKPAFAIY